MISYDIKNVNTIEKGKSITIDMINVTLIYEYLALVLSFKYLRTVYILA